MKVAELTAFGVPSAVARCIDAPEPGSPGTDEVIVEIEASAINPADLLIIEGSYAVKPPLPSRLGIEGVGRVLELGSNVSHVAPGDRVLSLDRHNWAQRCLVNGDQVIKLPQDIDPLQAAMLKANPPTAHLMLKDFVDLKAGDWVIQNAANSGVGTALVRLARARGIHTVNVVRRESAIQPLLDMGADVAVVDGDDLAERVKAKVGAAPIRLAIDAVAGTATKRLAACLADGGTVVNYGVMSGEDCVLGFDQAVFHDITLTGFWLRKAQLAMSVEDLRALYGMLADRVMDGTIAVAVEATYPLDRLQDALAHAKREGRSGKIVLTPNGALAPS